MLLSAEITFEGSQSEIRRGQPGINEFCQRLPGARRQLGLTVLLREGFRISGVADGACRAQFIIVGNLEGGPSHGAIETAHEMHAETHGCRLKRQIAKRHPGIVQCVEVRRPVVREGFLGEAQDQDRSASGPQLVSFHQRAQELAVRLGLAFSGHDEAPRLLVKAGRRPTSRFQQRGQLLGRDLMRGEGARAPAAANQFVNRLPGLRRLYTGQIERAGEDVRAHSYRMRSDFQELAVSVTV